MRPGRKIITIPISGAIDVTRVMPIIETPEFQRLGFLKQLGTSSIVFRGAAHTRYEHSLGVFAKTLERANLWHELKLIGADDSWNLALFSLLHDIGHGPYSHVTEAVCKIDHDQNGARVLERLEKPIKNSGGDFEKIKAMFERSNPLWLGVMHHPLGTDKLDYLDRDAFHTNTAGRPAISQILNYAYFIGGDVVIDRKIIREAVRLISFYIDMYDSVYLRKKGLISQRYMQKLAAELLASAELSEDEMWRLTDGQLDHRLQFSKNPKVRQGYDRFAERNIPQTAVSLKIEPFMVEELDKEKDIKVFGISEEAMDKFVDISQPRELKNIEVGLSRVIDIPEEAMTVVPIVSPWRLVPKDIKILLNPETHQTISLQERRPKHYAAWEETAKSYSTIRVCVLKEYRQKISEPKTAAEIFDYLMNLI